MGWIALSTIGGIALLMLVCLKNAKAIHARAVKWAQYWRLDSGRTTIPFRDSQP